MDGTPWGSLSTIRVRLTAGLAAALLPVLILGILQSAMSFRREGVQLREDLAAASERSAAAGPPNPIRRPRPRWSGRSRYPQQGRVLSLRRVTAYGPFSLPTGDPRRRSANECPSQVLDYS